MELRRTPTLEASAREGTYVFSSIDWAQLQPGRFEVCYRYLNAPPLRLSQRSMNLGFKSTASVTPRTSMFGIAADLRTRSRWFGREIEVDSIAMSRSTIELSTKGPAAFYSVSIDDEALKTAFPSAPDVQDLLERLQVAELSRDPLYAAPAFVNVAHLQDRRQLARWPKPSASTVHLWNVSSILSHCDETARLPRGRAIDVSQQANHRRPPMRSVHARSCPPRCRCWI